MSRIGDCDCITPQPLKVGAAKTPVCYRCGKLVHQSDAENARMNGDAKEFARWQIEMLRRGILQSERLIHEIEQRHGIQQ